MSEQTNLNTFEEWQENLWAQQHITHNIHYPVKTHWTVPVRKIRPKWEESELIKSLKVAKVIKLACKDLKATAINTLKNHNHMNIIKRRIESNTIIWIFGAEKNEYLK